VDAQQGGPLFPNLLFSGFFIDKYPWNATLHGFKQFFFFFGKHLSKTHFGELEVDKPHALTVDFR
jgi:hypothetical protein